MHVVQLGHDVQTRRAARRAAQTRYIKGWAISLEKFKSLKISKILQLEDRCLAINNHRCRVDIPSFRACNTHVCCSWLDWSEWDNSRCSCAGRSSDRGKRQSLNCTFYRFFVKNRNPDQKWIRPQTIWPIIEIFPKNRYSGQKLVKIAIYSPTIIIVTKNCSHMEFLLIIITNPNRHIRQTSVNSGKRIRTRFPINGPAGSFGCPGEATESEVCTDCTLIEGKSWVCQVDF